MDSFWIIINNKLFYVIIKMVFIIISKGIILMNKESIRKVLKKVQIIQKNFH